MFHQTAGLHGLLELQREVNHLNLTPRVGQPVPGEADSAHLCLCSQLKYVESWWEWAIGIFIDQMGVFYAAKLWSHTWLCIPMSPCMRNRVCNILEPPGLGGLIYEPSLLFINSLFVLLSEAKSKELPLVI